LLRETDIANVLPQLDGARLTRAVARVPSAPAPSKPAAASRLAAAVAGGDSDTSEAGASTPAAAKHAAKHASKHKKLKLNHKFVRAASLNGLRASVRGSGARK
jgi:hypothetical protein